MFVGSNYLDHHWLWDGIAGVTLAFTAVWLAGKLLADRRSATARVPALVAEVP
jgi:membrane-associated phospholipid phosphatase